MKLHAVDERETIMFGQEFGRRLKGGDVVLLSGKLGAGKTTFVKGVAKALQVPTRIISPTFVIARTHEAGHHTIKQLYHLDLYRLTTEEEVKGIDIQNMVDSDSVVLIEWPELSYSSVKRPYYKVEITYANPGRDILISHEE